MIWAESDTFYSSTNGRVAVALFRVQNTTNTPITWTPHFYYSAYPDWGERAGVAINGSEVWTSGGFSGLGQTSVDITVPPNQTSTVIFSSTSGPASGLRGSQLGFYNNSLDLPTGLAFVDDLDSPTPYRWQAFNTYDNGTGAWLMGNNPDMFGGVHPSNWTDGNYRAGHMSTNLDTLATLLTRTSFKTV
jgi:hypothetical protein